MHGPSSTIVGRDPELDDISAFLDRVQTGPSALVLEGSAGIGKTTLWSAGVRVAQQRGYRVLTARAAESEARLSYAALGDLLGSVSADAFAGMPPPLRQAIDAALLRTDGQGVAPDQRAVSLATAHALRNLSWRYAPDPRRRRRPVAGPTVGPRPLVRPAAPRRRTDRRARVAADRPGLTGRPARAGSGHAQDDAPRGGAARTGARSGGSSASEPAPTSRVRSSPGSTGSRAGTRCSRSRWPEPRSATAPSPSRGTCGRCPTTCRSSCQPGWPPCPRPPAPHCWRSRRRRNPRGTSCSRSPARTSGRSAPWIGPRRRASSSAPVDASGSRTRCWARRCT